MKEFEIWSEGYIATGESATAQFHGKASGETFEEACRNFTEPKDIIREYDGKIIVHKGDHLDLDLNEDGSVRLRNGRPSIWACRLYDNEFDARKSFG